MRIYKKIALGKSLEASVSVLLAFVFSRILYSPVVAPLVFVRFSTNIRATFLKMSNTAWSGEHRYSGKTVRIIFLSLAQKSRGN